MQQFPRRDHVLQTDAVHHCEVCCDECRNGTHEHDAKPGPGVVEYVSTMQSVRASNQTETK